MIKIRANSCANNRTLALKALSGLTTPEERGNVEAGPTLISHILFQFGTPCYSIGTIKSAINIKALRIETQKLEITLSDVINNLQSVYPFPAGKEICRILNTYVQSGFPESTKLEEYTIPELPRTTIPELQNTEIAPVSELVVDNYELYGALFQEDKTTTDIAVFNLEQTKLMFQLKSCNPNVGTVLEAIDQLIEEIENEEAL